MKKNTQWKKSHSYSDKIFDVCNVILMLMLLVVFVWPLWFVLIASVSDFVAVSAGQVVLLPRGINLDGYRLMLEAKELWSGYANTIFVSVVGTVLNLIMTVCCAYPLSRTDFVPRKVILYLLMVTMYFSGGMVPSYLVVKQLDLVNTRWAMIIPSLVSFYNCLVVRTYYINSIPRELNEAATIDGANSFQYLVKVVLPLSKPVMAVVGLYYFVGHWNDFYSAKLYIYETELLPLQSVLRNLLMSTTASLGDMMVSTDPEEAYKLYEQAMSMKYGVIIVAAIPVLILYPFIQKFFVKGIMVGSVKG